MKIRSTLIGTLQKLPLAASTLVVTVITALAQSNQPNPDGIRGTPGVATQRAVVNFAELARQIAPPAALPADAGPATPAGFTLASMGGTPTSPTSASSFLALLGEGELVNKPDTQGAVGPNHLMVTLNTSVRIQTRDGAVISTVSLSNFWSAVGPFATRYFEGLPYDAIGDPKVIYEPYDNRWIVAAICDYPASPTAALLLGVSQTSDPTGSWNLYRIDVDPNNQRYAELPSIGFNKDWIVLHSEQYNISGLTFNHSRIYVFSKTNLYAGGLGQFTFFTRPEFGLIPPASTYDTNLATVYLLHQEGSGANVNSLRLFTVTGPVGAEVLTIGPIITATSRWDYNAPGGTDANFAPQLGSPKGLINKSAWVPYLVYRNGSLWSAQTIFLPAGGAATRSAVQWWQLSPQGAILQRGLIHDPTGRNFYALPSIAVNRFNDVLIGYNRFSSNQYASANYAFRAGSDPPNTLRADTVLKAGEAPVDTTFPSDPVNGWGDYSATVVDPLNDTDLWTIQEYASTPLGGFGGGDNWGTWWGRIVPPALTLYLSDLAVTEGDTATTNVIFNLTLSKTYAETITVDFTTADGSARAGQDYTATNGTLVFNPGETNKTISVLVLGDRLDEADETFFLNLSNPTNIVLAYTQVQATILDDDPVSFTIAINDLSVREGDAGLADATFTLSLSTASGLMVSVRAVTASSSATLRVDFVPTNIVVTIPPGATSQPVTIKIIGDTLIESNETFVVNLSSPTNATIADSQGKCTLLDDDFKVTAVQLAGGDVSLSFTTQTNLTYRIERTDDLGGAAVWTTVPGASNVPGTGASVQFVDLLGTAQPRRFYRIRVN